MEWILYGEESTFTILKKVKNYSLNLFALSILIFFLNLLQFYLSKEKIPL